jgi:hypothetical protein
MSKTRIKYERTGGFAGLKLSTSFELDDLPDEQEKQVLELLDDVDFFDLPPQLLPARPGSDQFTHKIEVDGKKGKHTVLATDSAAPEKLRELIGLLNLLARTHRKKD